jgi:uracil-DNA glycosylase
MPHDFDSGSIPAFDALFRDYPDETVYPHTAFRTEWGPVFYRGRLNGSARVLVIGQDPAQSENIARRILVGVAGHRFQGFLSKLGIDRSYTMINTFLYSVLSTPGATTHQHDAAIVDYRNKWIETILTTNSIDIVIALGSLASDAWTQWQKTAAGKKFHPAFAHITHPTQPESAAHHNAANEAELTKALLENWNAALQALRPHVTHPDAARPLVPYTDRFHPADMAEIPEADLSPGAPAWMRSAYEWALRKDSSGHSQRYLISVTVPKEFQK